MRMEDGETKAAAKAKAARPLMIGWREWVSLPELGIERIKVKVDTGARSSSLHAHDIRLFRRRGVDMVRFTVHPVQRQSRTSIEAEAELLEMRKVRNSGGRAEERPVIRTSLGLLGRTWHIELTLTPRDVMGFRMLLGRQAVRGRFLVDPGRSYHDTRAAGHRRTRIKRRHP